MIIDTDVILDVALDRAPHARASGDLLRLLERSPRQAFVAWHTLANLSYLLDGTRRDDTRAFLQALTGFLAVAPGDGEAFRRATSLRMKDFEDAMQVGSALEAGCDVVVTRNVRDYRNAPLEAITPVQALERLG
jgi:predicted nucleic acid-binding protein